MQRTGWGKSIVYFLVTRLLRERGAGPTLLVSPLLALMSNQIAAAQKIGIRAETINSTNFGKWKTVEARLLADEIDILLISPEKLANTRFRDNVLLPLSERLGFLVIDEAHCISDWGHDFRPDYRRIVRVLQALPPTIPVLATTATANNRVVDDVVGQLGEQLKVIRGPLTRKSLQLQNLKTYDQAKRLAWLAQHIPELPNTGIIYTLTTRDAKQVAQWLITQGIKAEAYSGKTKVVERSRLEDLLLKDQIKVLVATSALGMGYDKPNLGFVIHYQRPGSVIHYYQQVGRAGRAINHAYGILMSGAGDKQIIDYFIRTAFPPEAHVNEVLAALEESDDGLSTGQLQKKLNLSKGSIDKVLKQLSVETPSPVAKQGSKWLTTPVQYTPDRAKIEQISEIRQQEQRRMSDYANSEQCLMNFLAAELDDPQRQPCGKCAVCLNRPLVSEEVSPELVTRAVEFLKRSDQIVEPRKKWPDRGSIGAERIAETGRALCLWNDVVWGALVRTGKYQDKRFSDELVEATYQLVQRWQPQPQPAWVTCVPSLRRPYLVPDFAKRLADRLGLPFQACVTKTRETPPQKEMNNSYQQTQNLADAFLVQPWPGIAAPVYLVDDMVDSRWTFTIAAALLREAGSGPVFPLALALNSLG